jgi:hypothetical protein
MLLEDARGSNSIPDTHMSFVPTDSQSIIMRGSYYKRLYICFSRYLLAGCNLLSNMAVANKNE